MLSKTVLAPAVTAYALLAAVVPAAAAPQEITPTYGQAETNEIPPWVSREQCEQWRSYANYHFAVWQATGLRNHYSLYMGYHQMHTRNFWCEP